jgi:hypothetical protein
VDAQAIGDLLKAVVGPWGATFLLLGAVVVLWRKLEQSQAMVTRQQDLFDEALHLIRDDIVPLIRDAMGRRR